MAVATSRRVALLALLLPLAACEEIFPSIALAPDAGEASTPSDASTADGGAIYNDITLASNWSAQDLASLGFDTAYDGAGFDGQFLYLVPAYSGRVVRYDTTQRWDATSSYGAFDMSALGPKPQAFGGSGFDRHFVYFVPSASVAVRYDSTLGFGDATSWSTFDTTAVNSNPAFAGSVFDGHNLYLVPSFNAVSGKAGSIVNRLDTTQPFTSSASWTAFDTTGVDPGASRFFGAVFDGRYAYFSPGSGSQGPGGLVARYDTRAPFTASSSWLTFDVGLVHASSGGCMGVAFDGRYVYTVPYQGALGDDGLVSRYDTTKPDAFAVRASWSSFDTTSVSPRAKAFGGAAFDGRYLYFVPDSLGPPRNGVIVRYDNTSPFESVSSWKSFDLTAVAPSTARFRGAVFDGRYVYLVPLASNVLVRFDAKSPPSMPAGYSGSFF